MNIMGDWGNRGFDLIFACSFGYADQTLNISRHYPNTKFMQSGGFITTNNTSTGFGRIYQVSQQLYFVLFWGFAK